MKNNNILFAPISLIIYVLDPFMCAAPSLFEFSYLQNMWWDPRVSHCFIKGKLSFYLHRSRSHRQNKKRIYCKKLRCLPVKRKRAHAPQQYFLAHPFVPCYGFYFTTYQEERHRLGDSRGIPSLRREHKNHISEED